MADDNTVSTVLSGTCIAATAGASVGATMAILRNAPIKQYAFATGLNCGIFGATFLIVRQTFAKHQRSKNPKFGLKDSQTRDLDDLTSSVLAGATTGGLLSAVYRGRSGVVPGSIMFGVLCGVGQFLISTGNRWRQDIILRENNPMNAEKSPPSLHFKETFRNYLRMPSWSPIRMISDEEYNELLDARLKALEMEVRELDREINQQQQNKS